MASKFPPQVRPPTDDGVMLQNVVRTLLTNGYAIDSFDRPAPHSFMMLLRKREVLGAEAKMAILFTATISTAIVDRVMTEANRAGGSPVVIFNGDPPSLPKGVYGHSLADFFAFLGGEVHTDRIFCAGLQAIMTELGHNRLPAGLKGKPDDLLEAYSADALQFLLECPVRRFGQERRFEPLPDGLVLGRDQLNIHIDAKAYEAEFHPSADDIRRFGSYVRDFNSRYEHFVGRISLFLVVSGSFSQDDAAIKAKTNDLLTECATPLVLLRAGDLGAAVERIRAMPHLRAAVNWRRIFVPDIVDLKRLDDELTRIRHDSIIP